MVPEDGWAPGVPMVLAGPFLESMRSGEWQPVLLFPFPSLRVLPMAEVGMDTEVAIMGEDAMEVDVMGLGSMVSPTPFRPVGRDGV
jgi:hypothetical protein